MANPQKRKGDKAELEVARLLTELFGTTVRRKLGAGRADDAGDLEGIEGVAFQVKNYRDVARAIREGLAGIEDQRANAGADIGVVLVRRRGGEWIAVQSLEQWVRTYKAGDGV